MPRKKIYRTTDFPYHVSARCTNKEWFALPLPKVWEIFSIYLYFITLAYGVRIHAFVLMSNHFHMLISTPNGNIDEAMNYLQREVSRRLGEETDRINQIFGGPYHWTLIKNNIYYHHAYKYVYRNPVKAGICKRVEDYRYSTLRGLLGKDRMMIPAFDNLGLIQNPYKQLAWLNEDYSEENYQLIKKALRHREFCFPADPLTGKKPPIDRYIQVPSSEGLWPTEFPRGEG